MNSKKVKKVNAKKNVDQGGRPSKLSETVVNKLEAAALLDCTISEMCFSAGISRETYYSWIKKDQKLSDKLKVFRAAPVFKARQELIKGLEGNPELCLKYLERKKADEFSKEPKLKDILQPD